MAVFFFEMVLEGQVDDLISRFDCVGEIREINLEVFLGLLIENDWPMPDSGGKDILLMQTLDQLVSVNILRCQDREKGKGIVGWVLYLKAKLNKTFLKN